MKLKIVFPDNLLPTNSLGDPMRKSLIDALKTLSLNYGTDFIISQTEIMAHDRATSSQHVWTEEGETLYVSNYIDDPVIVYFSDDIPLIFLKDIVNHWAKNSDNCFIEFIYIQCNFSSN